MKLSIYTFVKNGLELDFHVLDMLRHHLPLADEIIVNEGYSTDGTFERISDLDPKIKVVRSHWDDSDPESFCRKFKETARQRCSGDWCILLDCDEFIPEWEFESIRRYLAGTTFDIIPMNYLNFYGNYKVYNARPEKSRWPAVKHTIHRNLAEIEVWGDGSNVRLKEGDVPARYSEQAFECHHFGFVRHPARLRRKWHTQGRNFNGKGESRWIPKFLFDLFPHKWDDPDFMTDLAVYDGPYMSTVLDNPDEFIRDRLALYRQLQRNQATGL